LKTGFKFLNNYLKKSLFKIKRKMQIFVWLFGREKQHTWQRELGINVGAPFFFGYPFFFLGRAASHRSGKTPYNVQERRKACGTKFLLETTKMAELIALGRVIIHRMTFFWGRFHTHEKTEIGNLRVKNLNLARDERHGSPSTTTRVLVLNDDLIRPTRLKT